MAESDGQQWVEIIEPQSRERMFANPTTGEIVFTPPEGVTVKPMTGNQWWELYDQVSDKNYYYNAHTGETIWNRPSDNADIISLTKLQSVPPEEEQSSNPPQTLLTVIEDTDSPAPSPDQNGQSRPHSGLSNSERSRKTSDIFARDLGTLSPLAIEVQGERFSSRDPLAPSPSSQSSVSSGQKHSGQNTSSSASPNLQTDYAEDYRFQASPFDERYDNAHQRSPHGMGSPYHERYDNSHQRSPHGMGSPYRGVSPVPNSQSPVSQDEVFASEQSSDRRAQFSGPRSESLDSHDLRQWSAEAATMSYDQKARTLDLYPKPKKQRERLGSNPDPAPARTKPPAPPPPMERSKFRSPSHRAPPPPIVKSRSQDQMLEHDPKKTHIRTKSDNAPPIAPPFVPPKRSVAAKMGKKVVPLEGFQELAQHRKGFFRKKVTIANMLSWTKDPIKQPMIMTRDKQQRREACDLFKIVLQFMGDRRSKVKDPLLLALDITTRCWQSKGLRDELYIQLCRQTSANEKPKSLERGWMLFTICLAFFPPSMKFRSYLEGYLWRHVEPLPQNKGVPVEVYAQYCHKRVEKMTQSGAKKGVKKPSIEEIMHARDAPFHPSMFGTTLEEVLELQQDQHPDCRRMPWVVTALCKAVLQLEGCQTEGIFRVPGDIDEVNALKLQVEKGQLPLDKLLDPHIPASLLKLWFRELEDPLIPEDYYQDCIDNCDNQQNALSLISSLPDLNKKVLLYLVRFLQKFITPNNVEATKMGVENIAMVWAPNVLRCPSDDHALIFQNTRKEMAFLRMLLKYLNTEEDAASVSAL